MNKIMICVLVLVGLLSGCGGQAEGGIGGGMGPGGMSARHHAQVPVEYSNLKSPKMLDADIAQGQELYTRLCESCHGSSGMGDGPAAASLDPSPAPVAHTSTMLGDGYLYWRVSEGGAEFKSTMPGWKTSLNESEIWALIAYMRTLGGSVSAQTDFHDAMLVQAVEQGLITQTESDGFLQVHKLLDEFRTELGDELPQDMDAAQEEMLTNLVTTGVISQSQADEFARIHQLLLNAGLME